MLGLHRKQLTERLRAQTTTRKFGRGAAKRPRAESAFRPPKHIRDNAIQRLYCDNLSFWFRFTLKYDLKTKIRVDLQRRHI